jgi:RNA polymerase sigma-70 factor, ECF subfamily
MAQGLGAFQIQAAKDRARPGIQPGRGGLDTSMSGEPGWASRSAADSSDARARLFAVEPPRNIEPRRLEEAGRRQPVANHPEDLQLVARMLAGDELALELFGERCFKAVYRFALSRLRGDRELALEIVQTAMVKALGKLDSYRGEAALATWLCSCCRNEISMHFRRRGRAPVEVELKDELETAPGFAGERRGNSETDLLEQEERALVHLALDLVPEHYAQVLEWMYIERLPVKQIATRMGLHPKAAESLLTRARQAFRASYASLQRGS